MSSLCISFTHFNLLLFNHMANFVGIFIGYLFYQIKMRPPPKILNQSLILIGIFSVAALWNLLFLSFRQIWQSSYDIWNKRSNFTNTQNDDFFIISLICMHFFPHWIHLKFSCRKCCSFFHIRDDRGPKGTNARKGKCFIFLF